VEVAFYSTVLGLLTFFEILKISETGFRENQSEP